MFLHSSLLTTFFCLSSLYKNSVVSKQSWFSINTINDNQQIQRFILMYFHSTRNPLHTLQSVSLLQHLQSLLVFMLLPWDQPPNALSPNGSIHDKAGQEEHGKHEQPVHSFCQNAGQRPLPVFLCHSHIIFSLYAWKRTSFINTSSGR